jgi:hypothetical protein
MVKNSPLNSTKASMALNKPTETGISLLTLTLRRLVFCKVKLIPVYTFTEKGGTSFIMAIGLWVDDFLSISSSTTLHDSMFNQLNGTTDLGITYNKNGNPNLEAFSDSDWAGGSGTSHNEFNYILTLRNLVYNTFHDKFKINNLGSTKRLLDMDIQQTENYIQLNQEKYIDELLNRFQALVGIYICSSNDRNKTHYHHHKKINIICVSV